MLRKKLYLKFKSLLIVSTIYFNDINWISFLNWVLKFKLWGVAAKIIFTL